MKLNQGSEPSNGNPPSPPFTSPAVKTGATRDVNSQFEGKIRIIIADDQAVYRDGVRRLLEAERDIEVVGDAPAGDDSVGMAAHSTADVLLLSWDPQTGADFRLLRRLKNAASSTKIVLVTPCDDKAKCAQAIRMGIAGILPKESPTALMLKCIRKVYAGEFWVDRVTTAELMRQYVVASEQSPVPPIPVNRHASPLSRREREIVGLVVQGYKNRDISEKLFISEQTVKNHLHNIFEKLGVGDRLELALFALHHRLLDS